MILFNGFNFALEFQLFGKHPKVLGTRATSQAGNCKRTRLASFLLWVVCLFASHQAFASVSCTGFPVTDTFTFPSPISVPRDRNTIGVPLTEWVAGPANAAWWNCALSELNDRSGVRLTAPLGTTGSYYIESGRYYTIFNTSKPGVGLVMRANIHLGDSGWQYGNNVARDQWWDIVASSTPANVENGGQIFMRLIMTGPISAGTLSSFTALHANIQTTNAVSGVGTKDFIFNPTSFTTPSCTAEGTNVTLPTVNKRDFGSNITLGITPFQFTLRNCPAGMDSITYQVSPMSPIITAGDGTFANGTGTDMAQGVGFRITDGGNIAPVVLDSGIYTLSNYDKVSGNSALSIPMNVSYFRTDAAQNVIPGRVQGALQLTVWYK